MGEVAISDEVAGGIEPTAFDVLLGVGSGQSCLHAGNRAFRALISENLEWYESSVCAGRKHEKMEVASSVLRIILEGGGRFLKRDSLNRWHPVKNKMARQEILAHLNPYRYQTQPKLRGTEGQDLKRRSDGKQEQRTASHQETQAPQHYWRDLVLKTLQRSTETSPSAVYSSYLQNTELLNMDQPPESGKGQPVSSVLDEKKRQTSQGFREAIKCASNEAAASELEGSDTKLEQAQVSSDIITSEKLHYDGTSPPSWANGGRSNVASPNSTNDPWNPAHVTLKQSQQASYTVLHPYHGLNGALSDRTLDEKKIHHDVSEPLSWSYPVEWSSGFSSSGITNAALDAPITVEQQPLETPVLLDSSKNLRRRELRSGKQGLRAQPSVKEDAKQAHNEKISAPEVGTLMPPRSVHGRLTARPIFKLKPRRHSGTPHSRSELNRETMLPGLHEDGTLNHLHDFVVPSSSFEYSGEHRPFSEDEMMDQLFKDSDARPLAGDGGGACGEGDDSSDSDFERLLERLMKEGCITHRR